jgi:hypothetical protein
MSGVEKLSRTLPGMVEKIIKPAFTGQTEKAQIAVEGADHLYREIRIENQLTNAEGEVVSLKPGAEVEVTIQTDEKNAIKKPDETADAAKAS